MSREYTVGELVAMFTGRPAAYTRRGYPRHLMFTAEQWAEYDAWNELWDRQERKYGCYLPETVAAIRATARRIW